MPFFLFLDLNSYQLHFSYIWVGKSFHRKGDVFLAILNLFLKFKLNQYVLKYFSINENLFKYIILSFLTDLLNRSNKGTNTLRGFEILYCQCNWFISGLSMNSYKMIAYHESRDLEDISVWSPDSYTYYELMTPNDAKNLAYVYSSRQAKLGINSKHVLASCY